MNISSTFITTLFEILPVKAEENTMDEEIWEKIHQKIRQQQFKLGVTGPLSYKYISRNLKHAADQLYNIYNEANINHLEKILEDIKNDEFINGHKTLEDEDLKEFLDMELITTYFLLMGFSIENLLKCLLIIKRKDEIKPWNRKFPKFLKNHNLKDLATECGLMINNSENELLEKLSNYIKWMGRYPTPLIEENTYPIKGNNGTWISKGEGYAGTKPQEEVIKFYNRLLDEINKLK